MNLTSVSQIKELMEHHNLQFQKQFGQNFLINKSILERIAENAGENVLEIGPGIGSLTRELCENAEKVVAVEIDHGLIPVLGETLEGYDNVTVVNADIMRIDLPSLFRQHFGDEPVTVCANLPYNITTPVIMLLLESNVKISSVTIMIQKEVAQRLTAKAGSSEYGAITAAVAWYGSAVKLFDVSAGNFIPKPKVDSAVVHIDIYEEKPIKVKSEKLLFSLISAAFGQRRKTLVNALSHVLPNKSKQEIERTITDCGFSATIRGECLSISDFALLTNALSN